MTFQPVRTKADLDTLDFADVLEGYVSAERGDPEPGPKRGRSFWHGWRNRMIDMGELPSDDAALSLARSRRSQKSGALPTPQVGAARPLRFQDRTILRPLRNLQSHPP